MDWKKLHEYLVIKHRNGSMILPNKGSQKRLTLFVILMVLCTNISYSLNGLHFKAINIDISGVITDEEGEPLIGVNILVKGTNTGASTDFEGRFTLEDVDENAILVVSYVGYKTQDVPVAGKSNLAITMISDSQLLDEVVVVGYGTQKKASLTGSVASVEADELTKVPTSNVTGVLAGRLPGLIVKQNQGRPGSDGAGISVRGFGANNGIGGSQQNENPLLIVDGFERGFADLDPNIIESITILKDASAAVYGVKGGAGVILVTTKRGKLGKPVITFNGTYSIQENTTYPELANYQEFKNAAENNNFYTLAEFFLEDDSFQGQITPERQAALNNGSNTGTNWFDAVTEKSAPMQQYNLNVRGGTETIKYFASLGFLDQNALWTSGDFGFKKYNTNVNLDAKITDRLNASMGIGWRKSDESVASAGGTGDFSDITRAHPAFPAKLPNGNVSLSSLNNPFSPIASTNRSVGGFIDSEIDLLNANLTLNYDIPGINGLIIEVKAGINETTRNSKNLQRVYQLYTYDGSDFTEYQSQTKNNRLAQNDSKFRRLTTQTALRYNNTFGRHDISGLILYERVQHTNESFSAIGEDIFTGTIPYLSTASPDNVSVNGGASEYGRSGLVTRVNYSYDSKYLVEVSLRRDESAYFPISSRVGYFPGVSIGWVISKGRLLRNLNAISFLKMRLSASTLGNDNANAFDYIEGFQILTNNVASRSYNGYVFNGTLQQPIRTLGFPNKNITWQESNLYNAGIDMGFLENKLNASVDVFYRKRYNLLARDNESQEIPQNVGVSPPLKNIEERNNRGVEVSINYRDIFGDVSFSSYATFSWAREKWGERFVQQEFDDPDLQRLNTFDGEWVNRTFGYVFDGFFNSQEEIENATIDYDGGAAGNVNIVPGDIRLKDINGDGEITPLDQVVIGRSNTPETIFSLNTQAQWNGFDLTLFWQGAANFEKNFSRPEERGIFVGAGGDARTPFKFITDNIWTPETAGSAIFPSNTRGVTNVGNIDFYRKDSKYLRLKNFVLGYSLKPDILNKFSSNKMRIFISGTNLLTFDRMGVFPFDPETSGFTTYPAQKVFTFGINLSF